MKIAIISFTKNGCLLEKKLLFDLGRNHICEGYTFFKLDYFEGMIRPVEDSLKEWTRKNFTERDAIIFIGATGIAVRSIAPFIEDKWKDPAVLVIDEKGKFVIPILSGHVGGGNALACEISEFLAATPVLTTATDVNHCFAVDVFAKNNKLIIHDRQKAKKFSADLLAGHSKKIWVESSVKVEGQLPDNLQWVMDEKDADLVIASQIYNENALFLQILPRVWLGIGCKRDTSLKNIEEGVSKMLSAFHLSQDLVVGIASIDLKANEKGILQLSKEKNWPFVTYNKEQLLQVQGDFSSSDFVREKIGIDNVCERAAVKAANGGMICVRKYIVPGITLAAANEIRRVHFE